jgi:hypothetical protein
MPVVMGRTRAQIRQSIGYNLGAVYASAPSSTGSTTTLVDDTLIGGDDAHNGKWVVFSDASANTVEITRVSDYTSSSTTLTLSPAVADAPVAADSYELWDDEHSPAAIHNFIDQAVIDASDRIFDPVESLALHTDGHQLRHDVPSGLSMIQNIYYREAVQAKRLHAATSQFDEATEPSYFSQSLDTEDRRQGAQSLKIEIADGASAGEFITDSITSADISKYDYIEMWVKSTVPTSSGNLKLHLDNGTVTADGNDLESLDIPALAADTWTFCRVALANPETDTAIISVGLEYDSDLGACTVWLDDISVVANSTAKWERVPRNLWRIDLGDSAIVFNSYFHGVAPYHLLKLVGGDKPALLSSDSATSEIPDQYLIAQGTGMAFAASSGGPTTDPDQRRSQAGFWFGKASSDRRQFPLLTNVRLVA